MSSQQSGATNSSSLRPRNRRLISIEDDINSNPRSISPARSDTAISSTSYYSPKAPSPLPTEHPSRSSSAQRTPQRAQSSAKSWGFQGQASLSSSGLFSQSYWENSWTNIQGIASTFLGSDLSDSNKTGTLPRKKAAVHKPKYSISTPESWGPSASDSLAAGTSEEQRASEQAKRRERLLLANGESKTDSFGRHKRRISVDPASPALIDEAPDTRVYVHHVQKGDTLAGLSIRYNCPQTLIQKANGMWANDSIHGRRVAYIPVDSSGIRGRKIPTPKPSIDLIKDNGEDMAPTPTQTKPDWTIPQSPAIGSGVQSPVLTASTSLEADVPFIHDSWVSVAHIPQPLEIVKLPHKTLGFFPPARRKSVSFSDTTPPRSPNIHSPQTQSPGEGGRRRSPRGRRRGTSSASASASSYFLKQLRGPGGVGTLSPSTRSPGPSRDRLNELVATHLPILAASRSSFESVTSASSTTPNLGELSGRVEGWVRKMASTKDKGSAQGDLIELVEGWDSGGPSGTSSSEAANFGDTNRKQRSGESSATADEERLLRERFPVRGRVFEEQPRR